MARLPRSTILLGLSGSSACADAATLVELLRRYIAPTVIVVPTPTGASFTDLPSSMLVGHNAASTHRPLHIDLTTVAQEFIVCPATANTMAKAALGLADNLLTACILAYRRPIWFAPYANWGMWDNPVTQGHVMALKSRGHRVIDPSEMPGIGEGGQTRGVGCDWRTVIETVLRHYLHN